MEKEFQRTKREREKYKEMCERSGNSLQHVISLMKGLLGVFVRSMSAVFSRSGDEVSTGGESVARVSEFEYYIIWSITCVESCSWS